MRTYERGVEDETLSCGTGVVASVLSTFLNGHFGKISELKVKTIGGELNVSFTFKNNIFTDVLLEGPATFVFKGELEF